MPLSSGTQIWQVPGSAALMPGGTEIGSCALRSLLGSSNVYLCHGRPAFPTARRLTALAPSLYAIRLPLPGKSCHAYRWAAARSHVNTPLRIPAISSSNATRPNAFSGSPPGDTPVVAGGLVVILSTMRGSLLLAGIAADFAT